MVFDQKDETVIALLTPTDPVRLLWVVSGRRIVLLAGKEAAERTSGYAQ